MDVLGDHVPPAEALETAEAAESMLDVLAWLLVRSRGKPMLTSFSLGLSGMRDVEACLRPEALLLGCASGAVLN